MRLVLPLWVCWNLLSGGRKGKISYVKVGIFQVDVLDEELKENI